MAKHEHHEKAAHHHEQAAKHHREAAKHHQAGNHEKAAHHSKIAHGHHLHAGEHHDHASKKHAEEHGWDRGGNLALNDWLIPLAREEHRICNAVGFAPTGFPPLTKPPHGRLFPWSGTALRGWKSRKEVQGFTTQDTFLRKRAWTILRPVADSSLRDWHRSDGAGLLVWEGNLAEIKGWKTVSLSLLCSYH